MARHGRGLGVGALTSIGCSLLVVGCCAISAVANACSFILAGASPSVQPRPEVPAAAAAPAPLPTIEQAAPRSATSDDERRRIALFARARGHGEVFVRRADFGQEWPFTIDGGTLRCSGTRELASITFLAPDGRLYGLNGIGRSRAGAVDFEPIWAPSHDPALREHGGRVSIQPMIQLGHLLCPDA